MVQTLTQHPTNWGVIKEMLHYLRHTKIRRSDLVVKYGAKLVQNISSLGDEAWDVCEQIFLAALDYNQIDLAKECIEKLDRQFPASTSMRVGRLKGMLLEAECKFTEADAAYRAIVTNDPTDSISMKRMIAIRKAQGDIKTAITLLATYLEIWMADTEAWLELASLHVSQLQYKEAAFCYEELILTAPQNYLFYLKYAEILYTIGGVENYKTAKKYFAHSLELNDKTNARSLWGICACNLAISSASKAKQQDKEEGIEIFEWASKKLRDIYGGTDKLPIVEGAIQKLST